MKKRPRILAVGSFVMDLIVRTGRVPNEGETVLDGIDFKTATGGKGANQAVQAARLGADVTMVGKVGNDMFGQQLLQAAKDAGIETKYVKIAEDTSSAVGNIVIEVKKGKMAQNRIIVVPGANMQLTVEDVEFLKDTIDSYDMVILQQEIPQSVNEAVASYAYEKNVKVMLNPAPSRQVSDEYLAKITYLAPNEHEAADLTNIKISNSDAGVDLEAVKRIGNALLDRGVRNVIITLGSNGAAFINRDKFIFEPAAKVDEVLDPTAAGDSFIGAFCTALCMGMDEGEALYFAKHVAAITVSRMGAQPSLPTYDEVAAFMGSNK